MVGSHKVIIEKKIAEGGYADIFKVRSTELIQQESKPAYALKRMFLQPGSVTTSLNQISASNEDIVRKSFLNEVKVLQ